jgi:hypothetical protein
MTMANQLTPPNDGCSLVRTVTPSPRTAQHVTVQVTNQELFDLITNDASLSPESKPLYIDSLRRLTVGGSKAAAIFPANTSLLWVLTHPEQASELLCQELQRRGLYSPYNVNNYIQPLRAVMARHPYLKKLTDVRERWRQTVAELSETPLAEAAKLNVTPCISLFWNTRENWWHAPSIRIKPSTTPRLGS